MKKLLIVGLTAALVAGSLIAPADAKRKKKKKPKPTPTVAVLQPTDVNFYLRRDACGEDNDNPRISLEDGPDEGDECPYLEQPVQEVMIEAGEGALTDIYPATDGVPLTLDATRNLVGEFGLAGRAGGAQVTVEVLLSGTIDGAVVEIATGTTEAVDYAATPATGASVVSLDFDIPDVLDRKQVTGLELSTVIRGVTDGWVTLDDPASFITVPALI